MGYLSLNFVVPDDLKYPDSIEVVAVEGGKFFLRLSFEGKETRYLYPPTMHMLYSLNVGVHRHELVELCRELLHENMRIENEKKKIEPSQKSEKLSRRCGNKKP